VTSSHCDATTAAAPASLEGRLSQSEQKKRETTLLVRNMEHTLLAVSCGEKLSKSKVA